MMGARRRRRKLKLGDKDGDLEERQLSTFCLPLDHWHPLTEVAETPKNDEKIPGVIKMTGETPKVSSNKRKPKKKQTKS